jgi:hypothetical protein
MRTYKRKGIRKIKKHTKNKNRIYNRKSIRKIKKYTRKYLKNKKRGGSAVEEEDTDEVEKKTEGDEEEKNEEEKNEDEDEGDETEGDDETKGDDETEGDDETKGDEDEEVPYKDVSKEQLDILIKNLQKIGPTELKDLEHLYAPI